MKTNEPELKKCIRSIPDWPKKGILFRDVMPVLVDPKAFALAVDALCAGYSAADVDYIAAVEARGFIFGVAVARKLNVGFVPIRKKGKLPPETEAISYDLEYGTDTLEIQTGAVEKNAKVLMVDDLLATGGTMAAACELVEKIGGQIIGISFLIELTDLSGRKKLTQYNITTAISY